MKTKFFLFAVFTLLCATSVFSQETHTYLIIEPHTQEECMATIDDVEAQDPGILSNTYWGCMSGDHTAYILIQADSKEAALKELPESMQSNAKVLPVDKFTVEQIESMHKHMNE